ncbi:MAG TPA: PilZ domain-containing protein [Pyrinomonadaceae bacterium]|jgi:c-di-GMP-binding flagellar brake protein YcgR|nr:PilZ domain-containing protein [Pyrinomonadaceae bacterium]
MPELARSLVSHLRRFVGDRRRTKRQRVRLAFTLSLAGTAVKVNGARQSAALKGHTLDVSVGGIALIVPSILLGEHHLVGENRKLNVKLELPEGMIEMKVAPIRYESLEDHETETGYLIGAKIVEMSETDRERFVQYVTGLTVT